jgi:hypothetical protein
MFEAATDRVLAYTGNNILQISSLLMELSSMKEMFLHRSDSNILCALSYAYCTVM